MTLIVPTPTGLPRGPGVAIPGQGAEGKPGWYEQVLGAVSAQWWYQWTYPPVAYEHGRVKMCFNLRDGAYFDGAIAAANADPEAGWLVGNELEDEHQGNTPADVAARNMQRWVRETSNPFAFGGNLFLTPWDGAARHSGTAIVYLDSYLDAGGPVPPQEGGAWHAHFYCYAGTPEDDFDRQVEVMSTWMEARNVVRPLIVTETAWLYDNVAMQGRLMRHLHRRIREPSGRGTIQAAAWYQSGGYDVFPWTALLTGDGQLTPVGEQWEAAWQVTGQSGEHTVWLPIAAG